MKTIHNKAVNYRPEIDGLRAVAVLPVMLFHAGFGLFPGGYIGVDVFFVISGYLITSIILRETEQGTFSLLRFYERRARRILPALIVVILCCLPFAWAWMIPDDLKRFGLSMIAVASFLSNIYFWRRTDYFATAAEEQPLLHTWSLAVEEQYYVLFPLFFMLCWRFGRSKLFWITTALALASLVASQWTSRYYPAANFYVLPTRAWELLAGSLLALMPPLLLRNRSQYAQIASLTGLALIGYSVLFFDEMTPFPSVYTLVPVVGSALIIAFANQATLVGKVLSCRPLVGIGLISYSAYLWHQPIFAFARLARLDSPPPVVMLCLIALSLCLAFLSWKHVEIPFRLQKIRRRQIFTYSGVSLAATLAIGVAVNVNQGFESRFSVPTAVAQSISRDSAACFDKPGAHNKLDWLCPIGDKATVSEDFMLVGDSHMYSIIPGFKGAQPIANKYGNYVGFSGCPPLLGIYALRDDQARKNCHALNKRIFQKIKKKRIKTVVLVARWSSYSNGGYSGKVFTYLGVNSRERRSAQGSSKALQAGLLKTIAAYHSIGTKVILIAQVPQQYFDSKTLYYKAFDTDNPAYLLEQESVSVEDHRELQEGVNREFQRLQRQFPDTLKVVDFSALLCEDEKCMIGTIDESYYFDDDHLSVAGAERLAQAVARIM